ncbi:6102_t:CDS:2 [Paraglomus occultum]|uniref:6102_t:CDS:1 n=1 Tax=Paraglomus occultum TaxID=144539 RepID=A0A9N9C459_9GLOM|nr:6102_t:CDS:2 [Paraglomus occultum]
MKNNSKARGRIPGVTLAFGKFSLHKPNKKTSTPPSPKLIPTSPSSPPATLPNTPPLTSLLPSFEITIETSPFSTDSDSQLSSDGLFPHVSRKSKRLSAISATNVTKAYTINTGRKNSLPPVMDIFMNNKPGLSYVTFAEFRKNDEYPRYQITILTTLQKQENKLRQIGIVKDLGKSNLKGKKERKLTKEMDHMVSKNLAIVRRSPPSTSAFKFLAMKKAKPRTASVLLKNLELAIRDHKVSEAIRILSYISGSTMKKKRPSEANNVFLMAMAHRLEDVAMTMYERGIPTNINREIFVKPATANNVFEFKFPSYFILAVALGLHNLAKTMIRKANMNQTWYGLSPLIIALAQTSVEETTDRHTSAGSKVSSSQFLLVKTLLDNGADPTQGLPLEQFLTLRLLNSRKRRKSRSLCTEDVIDGIKSKLFAKRTAVNGETDHVRWVYPIDVAAATGNIHICRLLLSRMDAAAIASSTMCLFVQNDVMLTLELVRDGANVNQKDLRGNSPLHYAACKGYLEMVIVLLQFGSDVNAKNINGRTPLHEAIRNHHQRICNTLIDAGANTEIYDNLGQTVRDLGSAAGLTNKEIAAFLEGNKKENQQIKSLQQNSFKKKLSIRHKSKKRPSLIPTMMNGGADRIKTKTGKC